MGTFVGSYLFGDLEREEGVVVEVDLASAYGCSSGGGVGSVCGSANSDSEAGNGCPIEGIGIELGFEVLEIENEFQDCQSGCALGFGRGSSREGEGSDYCGGGTDRFKEGPAIGRG